MSFWIYLQDRTIYGATFIAVSINHPIVKKSLSELEIDKIKKDFDKIDDDKKLGYKIKISCDHPLLDKKYLSMLLILS